MNRKDISLEVGDEVVFATRISGEICASYMHSSPFVVLVFEDAHYFHKDGSDRFDINKIISINNEPVTDDPTLLDEMAELLKEICGDLWEKDYAKASELLSRYDSERKQ